MRIKKAIALLLVLALGTIAFTGCGTGGVSSGNSTEGAETSITDKTSDGEPLVGDSKLVIAVQQSAAVENFDTNWQTSYLEEKTGVDFEFYMLPADADDAKTKIALMVSSGETLPDVINMGLDVTAHHEYGQKGIFLDLTDYLADAEKMPNFNAIVTAEREFILNNSKSPDGKIYSAPKYIPFRWNEGIHRLWYNTEWLDTLGLAVPETTDDFRAVLTAMKENDPNGNGKADEIPMLGSKDGWGQRVIVQIMNAFIDANPEKQYFTVQNQKIVPAYTQEEWKQGLEFIKGLIDDNLVDPLSFTQDQNQLKALLDVDGGMVGFIPAGSASVHALPNVEGVYKLMGPLTGPNGLKNIPRSPSNPSHMWRVTKDASHPELAVSVADAFYTAEVGLISRYGKPGENWTDDPQILKDYAGLRAEAAGVPISYVILDEVWGEAQNNHWYDVGPVYRGTGEFEIFQGNYLISEGPGENNVEGNFVLFDEICAPFFPEESIPALNYTEEETEKIVNAKTAIDAYVYDQAVAFVTGNRSLDEWNSYIKELEDMGLTIYVETAQAAFERTQ